jgi:hypothetical protein
MFDGLEAEASQVIEAAKAFGCYNIRFEVTALYRVLHNATPHFCGLWTQRTLSADHDTVTFYPYCQFDELTFSPEVQLGWRGYTAKVGERPFNLKSGGERRDLIEDDSVVYVVVPSERAANILSLLQEHPEWAGRVQVIAITFSRERYQDEWCDEATFKVHGAGAPKEGTFSNQERATWEFEGKDFYILNHKVAWRGQVTDRDVAADINSLLAGNQLVVKTERVPEMKLPKYDEELESKLRQIGDLFEPLPRVEGFIRSNPSLEFKGSKVFSDVSPPVEKCSITFAGRSEAETVEALEEYNRLVEFVTQLFPYVQCAPMPLRTE